LPSIDRLDVQLLDILSGDARTGVVALASTLGVSRNTVQARLKRLEDDGVLDGYRPELCLPRAGAAVLAFIGLEIVQGKLAAVVRDLTAMAPVLEIRDQAGLQELIERIVLIDGVVHSTTTLALTTPLSYRAIPLLQELTRDTGWGRSTPAVKI